MSVLGGTQKDCCQITTSTPTTIDGFLYGENGFVRSMGTEGLATSEQITVIQETLVEKITGTPGDEDSVARWVGGEVVGSDVQISDTGEISGYLESQITISGTSYTINNSVPSGSVLRFTSSSAVTVTFASSLAAGWNASARQMGAGAVTFTGATNRSGHTDTAGQYAWVALACDSNTDGNSAVLILGGDTA